MRTNWSSLDIYEYYAKWSDWIEDFNDNDNTENTQFDVFQFAFKYIKSMNGNYDYENAKSKIEME